MVSFAKFEYGLFDTVFGYTNTTQVSKKPRQHAEDKKKTKKKIGVF